MREFGVSTLTCLHGTSRSCTNHEKIRVNHCRNLQ